MARDMEKGKSFGGNTLFPKDKEHPYIGKCSKCGTQLLATGFCEHCQAVSASISPNRIGECGHRVDVSGWCHGCKQFTATRWEVQDGLWIDTKRTDSVLPVDENRRRMRFLMECIGRGDKAALLDWAKRCAAAEPDVGWKQCVAELEGQAEEVPF